MQGFALCLATAVFAVSGVSAQENYENWPPLKNPFESTGGGGGILIGGYDPIVAGDKCTTDFTATEPGATGKVYYNEVVFDAVPTQGGILCKNGRWKAKDGSMAGETPFEVFIKDGVKRAKP